MEFPDRIALDKYLANAPYTDADLHTENVHYEKY